MTTSTQRCIFTLPGAALSNCRSQQSYYFGVCLEDRLPSLISEPVIEEARPDMTVSVAPNVSSESTDIHLEFIGKMIEQVWHDRAKVNRVCIASDESQDLFLHRCANEDWILMAAVETGTKCGIVLSRRPCESSKEIYRDWWVYRKPVALCEVMQDGTKRIDPSLETISIESRTVNKIQETVNPPTPE